MSNEELALLYQQGDKQALESLIENNGGIVRKISLKYNNINKLLELDDLIQAGTIGLINAANKYDCTLENKANFITYAFQSIEREIHACVNGRSSKDINNTKLYKTAKSLNTPVGEEEDTELLNMIDGHDNSMEDIEDKIYIKQLRSELEDAMVQANTLREREVLKLHYGWDVEPITVNEIGDMFSIPAEKANQIKSIALRKIQNSVWGRTVGKKYRDEIIGPYNCTYRDVEKKFDYELRNLYAM
jgi:RNA polymerase sigma factor (sigma-70 family)